MTPTPPLSASNTTNNRATPQKNARWLIGLAIAAITYGSLYPFVWDWNLRDRWMWWGHISTSDAVENIVLFLPLGWVLGIQHRSPRQLNWGVHFIWVFLLATILQIIQLYLPSRTPAFSDVIFNMIGWGAAWGLGKGMKHHTLTALPQLSVLNWSAGAICLIWLTAELFPFVPTMDVQTLRSSVKMLWLESWLDGRRIALHLGMTFVGLVALGESRASQLLPAGWRSPNLIVWGVGLAVLFLKTITVQQSIGGAVVLGVLGGCALYSLCVRHAPRHLFSACIWASLLTYLTYALTPLEFRHMPSAMHWLPFGSWLENDLLGRVRGVAFELLCYGGFIWAACRMGAKIGPVAFVLVLITMACEFLQTYLENRTGEMSAPVVVIIAAAILAWMEPPAKPRAAAVPRRRRRSSARPT